MQTQGPPLEVLTRRLAETPLDFLGEPHFQGHGTVAVAAVVGDLLHLLGTGPVDRELVAFSEDCSAGREALSITLLCAWLLADPWFVQQRIPAQVVIQLLQTEAPGLATQVKARRFVEDPERREELVRLTLARLGFRPAGETIPQAQDRLTTLSSTERARVLQAARAAEERARKIREALTRKAAEESADKWTRE